MSNESFEGAVAWAKWGEPVFSEKWNKMLDRLDVGFGSRSFVIYASRIEIISDIGTDDPSAMIGKRYRVHECRLTPLD